MELHHGGLLLHGRTCAVVAGASPAILCQSAEGAELLNEFISRLFHVEL